MPKKKFKATMSKDVIERLNEIHNELEKRGADNFDVNDIITSMIMSKNGEIAINQFVSDHTPDVYKAIQLLNTPGEGDKIRESFRGKDFGLSHKGAVDAAGNSACL